MKEKETTRKMRAGFANVRGLRDWYSTLRPGSVGVEVGSYKGESADIAAQSGNVARLTCVDPWNAGEWAAAESYFDTVKERWAGQVDIRKLKMRSHEAAPLFGPQSLDFVYIDACHDYDSVLQDIQLWRGKVKAGGIIGGHDYNPHFEGAMRAVNESFGRSQQVFRDGSWWVQLPSGNSEVFTYCSSNMAKALELALPSWSKHSRADLIHVWGDGPRVAGTVAASGVKNAVYHGLYDTQPSEDRDESWVRKMAVQSLMFEQCRAQFFAWLDADVVAVRGFSDAYSRLGKCHVGATRMFRHSAKGPQTANSGVIFYRHAPELKEFFKLWRLRAGEYRENRKAGIWFEQHAMSDLAHEGYFGRQPFVCAPLPEQLFNSEADVIQDWMQQIRHYRPKLLHFKAQRWTDPDLVAKALAAAKEGGAQ